MITRNFCLALIIIACLATIAVCGASACAATPSPAQALALAPSQKGVEYDQPKPDEVPKCKVVGKKIDGHVGWIVESPEGLVLRKFLDTDGDNVVDQWSFYKDGVEVYREIATKSGSKADQFRWLNTAGTRWGVDANGSGKITGLEGD